MERRRSNLVGNRYGASVATTLVGFLAVLAVGGVAVEAWQWMRACWSEWSRPSMAYVKRDPSGVAISLNGLERGEFTERRLPGFESRGVLFDRENRDWVMFGDAAPDRPGFPIEALSVAVRAMQLHLEAPGVDIRPAPDAKGRTASLQRVQFMGGTEETIVGLWFFSFDLWMKRASLGEERIPIDGIPVYWHRSVDAFERDLERCTAAEPHESSSWNRYWLCADDFVAIEDGDVLTFEQTPLLVLAEGIPEPSAAVRTAASPCSSRGAANPSAEEFARGLTAHLDELADLVPVREIEDFARLMAGLLWLSEQDPYRDLRPWLEAEIARETTPEFVPTLSKTVVREHRLPLGSTRVVHRHRLDVSGGVVVAPVLRRLRPADDALGRLRAAILAARPADTAPLWRFSFTGSFG